jgi:hypothetical protein
MLHTSCSSKQDDLYSAVQNSLLTHIGACSELIQSISSKPLVLLSPPYGACGLKCMSMSVNMKPF